MSAAAIGTGIGTWVKLPAPEVTEILGLAGADFVIADLSNSPLTAQEINGHITAAHAAGIACWVRLEEGTPPSTVGKYLDTGADGIIVPHVDTADQARRYVAAAYFPPDGTRGMGGTTRGGRWLLDGLSFYLDSARPGDATPAVAIMIESAGALEAVDEIAGIPGLAQLFVGPADLSVALGVPGQTSHQLVLDAMDRAVAAARQHGVKVATATGTAAAATALFRRGFDAVAVGNDIGFLGQRAKTIFTDIDREGTP